jgi:hypothetical protein
MKKTFTARTSEKRGSKFGREIAELAKYARANNLMYDHEGLSMYLTNWSSLAQIRISYRIGKKETSVEVSLKGNEEEVAGHCGKLKDIYKAHGFSVSG